MGSLQGLGYELEYWEYLVRFPVESEDFLSTRSIGKWGKQNLLVSVFPGQFTC